MSDKILEISQRHGREMYVIGIEHAISMFEIAGADALEGLRAKVLEEKLAILNLEHSRFNEAHYKNCDECYRLHLDFVQEAIDDERLDAGIDETAE